MLVARDNSNYIYLVFEPLTVYIFSNEQLALIQHILKTKKLGCDRFCCSFTTSYKKGVYARDLHFKDKNSVCVVFEIKQNPLHFQLVSGFFALNNLFLEKNNLSGHCSNCCNRF